MKDLFSLKQLIRSITLSLIPAATHRHSFFINDVDPELNLSTDQDILASVISALLLTTVSQTENDCIRISAAVEPGIVLLNIHERGYFPAFEMNRQIQQLMPMAENIGGSFSIAEENEGLDLAFRFRMN
jgi:hypothetical protein